MVQLALSLEKHQGRFSEILYSVCLSYFLIFKIKLKILPKFSYLVRQYDGYKNVYLLITRL